MSRKSRLVAVGVLAAVLIGILAGMAAAFGTDLRDLLSAWIDALLGVLVWALIAGGALIAVLLALALLARRRSVRRAAPIPVASDRGGVITGAPTATTIGATRLPDNVPGPRDFVPRPESEETQGAAESR
jgi:hypothetical protein